MLALVFKKCKRSLRAQLCNKGYFKVDDYNNCQKPSLLLREELQIPWEPGPRRSYCKGYPKFFWGIASCQNKLCSFLRRMILIWTTNYRMQRNEAFIIIPMRTGYILSSFFFLNLIKSWLRLEDSGRWDSNVPLGLPSSAPADHQSLCLFPSPLMVSPLHVSRSDSPSAACASWGQRPQFLVQDLWGGVPPDCGYWGNQELIPYGSWHLVDTELPVFPFGLKDGEQGDHFF